MPSGFPGAAELAVLRAWHAGLSSRVAVERYLGERRARGQSSRAILSRIRRRLAAFARCRQRQDLAALFEIAATERARWGRAADRAVEQLRTLPIPDPAISDGVELWLDGRAVRVLHAVGIKTLADLTVRVPRRRRWWSVIPGLGRVGARRIEAFFALHPRLTERARVLIAEARGVVVPWEQLRLPSELDGSRGQFRAPTQTCVLSADNDYDAVHAWIALHESPATQRAYRKEAERLILWAIIERGRPLSSLTTEDAVAYRAFLRRPAPHQRWVGPIRDRTSVEWRPFTGRLSARSIAYALSVLRAMFGWLIQQRYVLANPFGGIKVRGGGKAADLDASRAFTEGEWTLLRTIADGLEWSYGWSPVAAQRLRFVLDWGYATGLRANELLCAKLGDIENDSQGNLWLRVRGKGDRVGRVALPPLARMSLDRHLVERGLPVTRARWNPTTPLIGALGIDPQDGITGARLWRVLKTFLHAAAGAIEADHPMFAARLRRASPHWMRHTHATHALASGAELAIVRDNLRHASIATTSIYLHGDDAKRVEQLNAIFGIDKRSTI